MLFDSPIFLFVFLPTTVAAYIVVRQLAGPRAVLGLLLVASIFFYGWWNPVYVPLLLGLAVFNFVAAHDLLEYCFFVMFFPQLLAGPITHHSEIFSQVKDPWAFAVKPSNFTLGLTIFVIGLFKKVVLADHFGPLVSPAYDAVAVGQPIDFFLSWQAAVSFKLQLYFDFSGYSEMALGA